jgi:SAM-dependent methyltransferase
MLPLVMADRVRKLARALPSPFDRVLERSHARYVGIRSERLAGRGGEPVERDDRGLPVPPGRLLRLVSGHDDVQTWLDTGEVDALLIRRLLEENGRAIAEQEAILDFGCGCGRVARWWSDLAGPRVFGCDYDGMLTEWCKANLPFMTVKTNPSSPPLPFRRESFDFVYAISLFTHLTAAAQDRWMADVRRVLKPGGMFLFTVHGERFLGYLNDEQKARFAKGEFVILNPELIGMEGCGAFHPPTYVRDHVLRRHGFELVASVFEDRDDRHLLSPMGLQDNYLVRKKSG